MTLQNAPGDHEFPVRRRRRWILPVTQNRRLRPGGSRSRVLSVLALLALGGLVGALTQVRRDPPGSDGAALLVFGVLGVGVAIFLAFFLAGQIDSRAPVWAQRRYLRLSSAPPVSARQQQLLALDAVSDYRGGGWNSSLTYWPTWVEMPEQLRRRWKDGERGSPWPGMRLPPLAAQKTSLDRTFRVVSAEDVELIVADTLGGRGRYTRSFLEAVSTDDGAAVMARVASLSGVDEFAVRALREPHGDSAPRLLLATDVEHDIGAVRNAYAVGYLTAARAWELIEQLGSLAFDRFSSWDAYWDEVIVGHAFYSDSLEWVQSIRAALAGLQESGWPAADVPYPRPDDAAPSA